MAISRYYRYGGDPQYYEAEWNGMGQRSARAAETRSMGGVFWEEDKSTGMVYPPLGNDGEIDEDALYDHPMADWPPTRRSGPEPLDIVQVPDWQKRPLSDYQFTSPMGAFQLSDNEKRLAVVGAVAVAGWFYFKSQKKPRRKRRR